MTRRNRESTAGDSNSTLADIKKLLVLQLLAVGVPAAIIAETLQVDKSVISRMAPARKLKTLLKRVGD